MNLYPLFRKILFTLEAERAHTWSLRLLSALERLGLLRFFIGLLGGVSRQAASRPELSVKVMGIHFPNPIGLAAGLDKNGEHIDALVRCGFGFIEVGTVTPLAQPGNAKPRMFRLQKDCGIINRMGFNNHGVEAMLRNIRKRRSSCLLGINIGKNKNTPLEKAVDDYQTCFRAVYGEADYITINISSPNTPGLRALQHGEGLRILLQQMKLLQQQLQQEQQRYVPFLVKIAPDLSDDEMREIASTLLATGVDGVIINNTTNQRPASLQESQLAKESGGLSGAPITELSDRVLQKMATLLDGKLPIIAVGGITCVEDARQKLQLGASLVQIYSGFIYKGPALVQQCLDSIQKSSD